MKRVLCLYRVSTKQQVNVEDDIPVQRRECMAFIEKQPDWIFVGERLEKGVSGFKVSASKRDAIIEIKAMAERKEFDVLLVFMFDRLGRREDETPFLVEWFVKHGIEVWSTREGEQRIENRGDKLMNYIRYWVAGGESEKTSMRVKAAHSQMTTDGIWRGGKHPFGYKLVHNGRVGKRNRQLYDLVIDPEQAAAVQEIFQLVGHGGFGTLQVANMMNERHPEFGKIWTAQTIRAMVKNPTYTGRLHMNEIQSEPIESLRLVSDDDFAFVHYAMQKRIPQHARLVQKGNGEYGNTRVPPSEHSARLLSGLLYCANCGARLSGSYSSKIIRGERQYRPIYRCFTGNVKARKDENEKQVFCAPRIETAVLGVVHRYFDQFTGNPEEIWRQQSEQTFNKQNNKRKAFLAKELERLRNQEAKLRQEVLKSISGESAYDTSMLQSLVNENKEAIQRTVSEMETVRQLEEHKDEQLDLMMTHCQNIRGWAEAFDSAPVETKHMILAHLIESITVDKSYNLHIKFFITREEFHWGMQGKSVTISEADSFMTT